MKIEDVPDYKCQHCDSAIYEDFSEYYMENGMVFCHVECMSNYYKAEFEKLKAANVLINNLYNSAMDDVHNAEKRIETLTLENDHLKLALKRYEIWLSGR